MDVAILGGLPRLARMARRVRMIRMGLVRIDGVDLGLGLGRAEDAARLRVLRYAARFRVALADPGEELEIAELIGAESEVYITRPNGE